MSRETGKLETSLDNIWDLVISFAETFVPSAAEGIYAFARKQHGADDVNLVSDILKKGTELIRKAYDDNPTAEAMQQAEKLAKKLLRLESYEDVHTGASKKAFQELKTIAERRASNAQKNYENAVNRQNKAVANAQSRASTAQSLAGQPNTRNLRAVDDALGTDYSKYTGIQNAVTAEPLFGNKAHGFGKFIGSKLGELIEEKDKLNE